MLFFSFIIAVIEFLGVHLITTFVLGGDIIGECMEPIRGNEGNFGCALLAIETIIAILIYPLIWAATIRVLYYFNKWTKDKWVKFSNRILIFYLPSVFVIYGIFLFILWLTK